MNASTSGGGCRDGYRRWYIWGERELLLERGWIEKKRWGLNWMTERHRA